jgi:hypothetical protein
VLTSFESDMQAMPSNAKLAENIGYRDGTGD